MDFPFQLEFTFHFINSRLLFSQVTLTKLINVAFFAIITNSILAVAHFSSETSLFCQVAKKFTFEWEHIKWYMYPEEVQKSLCEYCRSNECSDDVKKVEGEIHAFPQFFLPLETSQGLIYYDVMHNVCIWLSLMYYCSIFILQAPLEIEYNLFLFCCFLSEKSSSKFPKFYYLYSCVGLLQSAFQPVDVRWWKLDMHA